MTTPRAALTSDDIPPGPFSEDDLRRGWNQQADEHNQWESLDSCEQLAWAQALAIRADRHAAALKAEPEEEGPTLADVDELCAKFNFHLDDTQAYSHGESLGILQQMICDALSRWWWRAPAALETNSRARDLQELLAKLLDSLCLPGHEVTEKDWRQACLLAGRYCEPFLSKSSTTPPAPEAGEVEA